jgi:predicted O-methyltransferase YrrM
MEELSFLRPPSRLTPILERTKAIGFGLASETRTGALLRTLAASKPGGRFLELGTGTGVATCWLLDGMDIASELTSVDVDSKVQAIARAELSGDTRLRLITEDALVFLGRQEACSFDLVFADAIPGKYEGLDHALRVVKRGGFYVIDDMLPQPNWPEGHTQRVPLLMEQLFARQDFRILPMAWASGVILAVRK